MHQKHIGFTSCLAHPGVWMRPALESNGQECYENVLLCVSNALVVSHESEDIIRNQIGKHCSNEGVYWSIH